MEADHQKKSKFCTLPGGSTVKNLPASAGNPGPILGLGRSPRVGNGNPLQYSCMENPMDREAWWAKVSGVENSQPELSEHRQAPKQHFRTQIDHWMAPHWWTSVSRNCSALRFSPSRAGHVCLLRMALSLLATTLCFECPWW